jgi:hypothetical protein
MADPVYRILHIGDSISKLGITSAIGTYLSSNYPSINYISSANTVNP